MSNTARMSSTKKQSKERPTVKKMSKAQLQLAIIKKKQCDAKALAIVEQLLETNVNSDWLLQNLKFINKSHMEDVIEERAIVKLCGYVLCSKPLTVVIRQQYHISTRRNKVYDISRRKHFCSSLCYGAANYLLEQMLESPLWLREVDDVPVFQILPITPESKQCIPGEEINVGGLNLSQNIDAGIIGDSKEFTECSTSHKTKDVSSSPKKENICSPTLSNDIIENNVETKEIPININSQKLLDCEMHSSELYMSQENKDHDHLEKSRDCKNNCDIQEVNLDTQNLEIEAAGQLEITPHLHECNSQDAETKHANVSCINSNSKTSQFQLNEVINKNDYNKMLQPLNEMSNDLKDANETLSQFQLNETNNKNNEKDREMIQLDETCNGNTAISSESYNEHRKKRDANSRIKKKSKQKESDNAGTQENIYHKLVMRVEQSVKEWVTESTLCLLIGEMDEKRQLLESLTQHDRYQQLCKKLNRLQLEDEKEERVNSEKNVLKPLPHFSVLQEEAGKMDLKVRAFYEGRMTIGSSEDSKDDKESENKDDDNSVLPLTDAHAPNALRRRIFLDKLNKILPDLMRALMTNTDASLVAKCTYNHEKYSLIKILISTFNLSASNIVFKTAEWTLVGLIVIKMLSLMDVQIQSLLQSKQASMYTSMILMTYKLDSSYLDRLIMEITNTSDK